MIENIINIDKKIFIFLHNLGSEKWDFLFLFFSNKISMLLFVVFFITIYCYKMDIKKLFYFLLFFVICLGLTDFLHVRLFKNVFMRLRPCWENDILSNIRPLILDCGGRYGFISGHAANSAAMVTFLIYSFKNQSNITKYSLLIWMLAVSYSRIYLAKHYLLDVFCGIFFGFLIGVCFFNIYKLYINKNHIK
tara:strand:- start:509 stop:1084 length:576 start_codon:yes stop_codon:yes gene_type:complete